MGTQRLSAAEVEHYREHGYVVPAMRIDDTRLGLLRDALARVVEANPGVRPEKLVSVHIAGRNPEGIVGDAAFLDACRDPLLLDAVAQLIGEDIVLWGCQAFCKPGGDGLEVPMHQDGQYWPIRPLATCTVWVALDRVTRENGCMRFVPGSHHGRRLRAHEQLARDDVALTQRVRDCDEAKTVDIELEAGEMSMHDVYLVHGSNANRSTARRAGLAIRYMPASSHFRRDLIERSSNSGYTVDFSSRPLWLLRGRDASGVNDFRVGHPSAP